mmetsp:Transcript_2570/g.6108  ORF Transcript_2570/g.6108 Transcript_2570/m.6108 type:complete len:220 (-) Transcript_2570:308-967(-)
MNPANPPTMGAPWNCPGIPTIPAAVAAAATAAAAIVSPPSMSNPSTGPALGPGPMLAAAPTPLLPRLLPLTLLAPPPLPPGVAAAPPAPWPPDMPAAPRYMPTGPEDSLATKDHGSTIPPRPAPPAPIAVKYPFTAAWFMPILPAPMIPGRMPLVPMAASMAAPMAAPKAAGRPCCACMDSQLIAACCCAAWKRCAASAAWCWHAACIMTDSMSVMSVS